MNKGYVYLIICFLYTLFTAMMCTDSDIILKKVTLENASSDSIYYAYTTRIQLLPITPYSIFFEDSRLGYNMHLLTQGGKDSQIGICIGYDPPECLGIIIFKKSTMERYTKEELVYSKIYDAVYTLTLEDLKELDYKIIYTGE